MTIQPLPPASARRRKRREVNPWYLIAGAAVIIVAGLVVMALTRDPAPVAHRALPTASAAVTETAVQTAFRLPGLEGVVALDDFQGRYVLINFWATWCPPCRAEMPDLNAYHQSNTDKGFSVLAVNVGESRDTVESFIHANRFDFPVALDVNSAVFAQYRRESLPSSFLIGPDGTLVKAWPPGALSRAMLERDITPLLAG